MKRKRAFGYRRIHSGFNGPEVEADTAGWRRRPVVPRGLGAGEPLSGKRAGQDRDTCGM